MPAPGSTEPPAPSDSAAQPPTSAFNEALASAGEGGTQPSASYAPGFFGDFLGDCVQTNTVVLGAANMLGSFCPRTVCLPSPSAAGGIKPGENESPRPIDRFFYQYTFYGNVDVRTPQAPDAPPLQLNRHIIGFEKTFLDGDASIGLRLPFLSYGGDIGYEARVLADMTIVTKYAFVNNRETQNVGSGGLLITVPSGGTATFFDGLTGLRDQVQERFFAVFLTPWAGYVYNFSDRLYFHGFHSITIPTDSRETFFISNDVAFGYWLRRDATEMIVRSIVPTFEVHVNTPLNNRGPDPMRAELSDTLTLTCGCYFILSHGILGGAVGIPVIGEAGIEALATYTLRF
jgi:hypothetical protein